MDSAVNDKSVDIGSIRIVISGLLGAPVIPVEFALVVNEGTPDEVRLGTKELYETGFLHTIITEAREHIERYQAKIAGRYREPSCRCQLCNVGMATERQRLGEFAIGVLRAQARLHDRVI